MLLLDELRDAWRREPKDHRVALGAIVLIAVLMRLRYLSQPIRYDEAVTYLEFVRRPLTEALSWYSYPNNHLFHTLLAKVSAGIFGADPWALRLPAFIAGVAIVPATYAVGRALYGPRPALIAAAFASTSAVLVLFSTNARGYSIVGLAFLLLVLLAVRIMQRPTWTLWLTFAGVAALGMWTIPTMLYPVGAVALWITLQFLVDGRHDEWKRFSASIGIAAAATLVLYTPVFVRFSVAAVVRNKYVEPRPWPTFLDDLAGTSWEALQSWGLGLPAFLSIAAFLVGVRTLVRHAHHARTKVGLPLAAFVWCAYLLVISHRAPFARVWLWLFPLAALLVATGLVVTLDGWARSRTLMTQRAPLVAISIAILTAASVVWSRAVLLTKDTGTFVEAERTAAILSSVVRPGDLVIALVPTNAPLDYWFHRRDVDSTVMKLPEEKASRIYVVVDKNEGQTLDVMLEHSPLRDTTVFAGRLVAELPLSAIVAFERKHVPAR